uniref:Uncharacterized protein n=1 Tax=Tetraselmis sp. GSL018 TaxID=582737 RepID=A0A061S4A9_9CHLO
MMMTKMIHARSSNQEIEFVVPKKNRMKQWRAVSTCKPNPSGKFPRDLTEREACQ